MREREFALEIKDPTGMRDESNESHSGCTNGVVVQMDSQQQSVATNRISQKFISEENVNGHSFIQKLSFVAT